MKYEQEVKMSNEVEIIKFGASWCGPCKDLDKVFEAFKNGRDSSAPQVTIENYDRDKDQDQFDLYGIRSVPTVLFRKSGSLKKTITSGMSLTTLIDTVAQVERS